MHASPASAHSAIMFGFDPTVVALSILGVSYIALFTEKFNRAVIALLGASVMIFSGVLSQKTAVMGIDFNTISLLIGMMMIVGIAEKSGMFQYVAVFSAQAVKASPRGILIMLAIITAAFSAFLDNVTTVLLIVPVTFAITKQLKVSPYPFLYTEIAASNIGGTATLIGDPPNILIGSAKNLSFMDFLREMSLVVTIIMIVLIIATDFFMGRKLSAHEDDKKAIMALNPKDSITDVSLLIKSLIVLFLVIVGFIVAERIHIPNGVVAIAGAVLLLFIYTLGSSKEEISTRSSDIFGHVDWVTIFFFAGLFVIVYGVEETGFLAVSANYLLGITKGDIPLTAYSVLWLSAIVSAIIDNIPFVATMIPLLNNMEAGLGGFQAALPVWWALALGACLGGNGSLIGASANVMVAGMAEKNGSPISFGRFFLYGIPVMIVSVAIAHVYLYFRYWH